MAQTELTCPTCKKKFLAENKAINRGRKYCSFNCYTPQWSDNEKKQFAELWQSNTPIHNIIKKFPNRTTNSFYHLATELKVKRPKVAMYEHQRKQIIIPPQTEDFAWFLGVLCGDGCVINTKQASFVRLNVCDVEFADKFCDVGKKLFGIEPQRFIQRLSFKNSKWRDSNVVVFNSRNLVNYLGDFRKQEKYNVQSLKTMNEKYSWVFQKEEFIIPFLTGVFDSEGYVKYGKNKTRIAIACKPDITKNMIIDLLNKIGIIGNKTENGLNIDKCESMIRFCSLIICCIPEKQEKINLIRQIKVDDSYVKGWELTMKFKKVGLNSPTCIWKEVIKDFPQVTLNVVQKWCRNECQGSEKFIFPDSPVSSVVTTKQIRFFCFKNKKKRFRENIVHEYSGVSSFVFDGGLRVDVVLTSEQKVLFERSVVAHHSYMKSGLYVGRRMNFLVYKGDVLVGVVGFGQHLIPEPKCFREFVGGDRRKRAWGSERILNNYRFCMVNKEVESSKVLSRCVRLIPDVWEQKYGVRPVLLVTFVHRDWQGTVYKAANWVRVGETAGSVDGVVKGVWTYALADDWKSHLQPPPVSEPLVAPVAQNG